MEEAGWHGEDRRAMGQDHHRKDDNPTWRWVAVTALAVISTVSILSIQQWISFASTLNRQVQEHEKTIAVIQQDVSYIKDGVEQLVKGQN